MIKSAEYNVIQIVNISQSLLSQVSSEPSNKSSSVYKSLVRNDSFLIVLYLLDIEPIGPGSTIRIKHDIYVPVVKNLDIEIIFRTEYSHSVPMINEMLKAYLEK